MANVVHRGIIRLQENEFKYEKGVYARQEGGCEKWIPTERYRN